MLTTYSHWLNTPDHPPMATNEVLTLILMYVFLPLWGIAGFIDWCCHRATKIETTSGIIETIMHSIMGIQIGIPILLCLLFQVNILILLICLAALALHEIIAHLDVRYAAPRRTISIWEMHAHSYLATLPLYMLSMIAVINWETIIDLVTLNWQGEFSFVPVEEPHGSARFLPNYLIFMAVVCVFPYIEELARCVKAKYFSAPV